MEFKEHLKKYLTDEFIENLINSLSENRTRCLILNTNKIDDETFIKMFPKTIKHEFIPHVYFYDTKDYDFGKSYMFDNGLFYIMDSSSLLVSYLLPINGGEKILDMCAAPGGKTISTALRNSNINILSNDINHSRSLVLSSNIERLGLKNVIVSNETINKLENYYKNTFDIIILDAPCSGSAMFRKNSEMKDDWTYEKVMRCSSMQKTLLEQAANMLKNGGIISYSTCSFSYEENEEIINNFLIEHGEFSIIEIENNPSFYRDSNLPNAIHLFPNMYNGEGQFICLLKKNGTLSLEKSNKVLNKYGFEKIERINDKLFAYNEFIDLSKINIIKKGIHVSTYKGKISIPSFNYAHYLNNENTIRLNIEDLKKYLHGDQLTTNIDLKDDYYIVSYNNLNLGYVHKVGKNLKNLYPKGLRH